MEQMDIPSILLKGVEGIGFPINSPQAIDTLKSIANRGADGNTVLDQFGNTVFLTTTKVNDKNIRVAITSIYNSDTPKNLIINTLKYMQTLEKRRVGLFVIVTLDKNIIPIAKVLGNLYPVRVVQNSQTKLFMAVIKVVKGRK